jgi:Domain of unknown function (DUF4304)
MALDAWKKLVASPVAELLKQRGFRKSGLNFSASGSGVTLLVSLQSSTGSTQGSLKITCNLGIRVEQLATRPGSGVWDAHWRERIGFFLPEPRDYWWVCSSDEDARRVGYEIAALLENRALPTMEELATPAALAALWSSGSSPGLTERLRVEYLSQLVAAGTETTSQ